MRIPFSQLAFPATDRQVWGINFSRRYLRCNGARTCACCPAARPGATIRRFPDLVGIEGVTPGQRLEVLAFGVARPSSWRSTRAIPSATAAISSATWAPTSPGVSTATSP